MDAKKEDFGIAIKYTNTVERIEKASMTPSYLSSEPLDKNGYSFCVDVWAFGVTLYKMVAGCYPFDNMLDSALYDKTKLCDYYIPSKVSIHTGEIIRILLIHDPDKGPLHGYNVIALTKNKNIPEKDCRLNSSHRIEDIFQKEFNVDGSCRNKNIPPIKDELNVEEQSNYLLKDLHIRISTLIGSSTPEGIIASLPYS